MKRLILAAFALVAATAVSAQPGPGPGPQPQPWSGANSIGANGGYEGIGAYRTVTLPTSWASSMAGINLGAFTAYEDPERPIITYSRTPEQVFGDFSTALSAPAHTYYVNCGSAAGGYSTGSDSNNGLSAGAAVQSINHAITLSNAATGANEIDVLANSCYGRTYGFPSTSNAVSPTTDTAFLCAANFANGVLGCNTFVTDYTTFAPTWDGTYTVSNGGTGYLVDDTFILANGEHGTVATVSGTTVLTYTRTTARTANTAGPIAQTSTSGVGTGLTITYTYPHTASQSISGATSVADIIGIPGRFNQYPQLINVSTPDLVEHTPGSWNVTGGVAYMDRADGVLPTTSNTRFYRNASYAFLLSSNVNVYIGSTGGARFNFEGGSVGSFAIVPGSLGGAKHIVVIRDATMRYGFRGISLDSFNGYVLCYSCDAGDTDNDVFNVHNSLFSSAADVVFGCINCTGENAGTNGLGTTGNTSNQIYTGHESSLKVFALGGYASTSAGGLIRFINSSQFAAIDLTATSDRGDIWTGGSTLAADVDMNDTSTAFLDGVRAQGLMNVIGIECDAGATCRTRNMQPWLLQSQNATILPWTTQ